MNGPVQAGPTSPERQTRPLALGFVLGALAAALVMCVTVGLVVYLALALSR
jgi:hypothetical protein